MLRQVWTNLISNAGKYSSKRDRPRVEIAHALEGGRIVYRIADNGVGLAIAMRIVKRHDGDIQAVFAPGEGATFSFYLGTG